MSTPSLVAPDLSVRRAALALATFPPNPHSVRYRDHRQHKTYPNPRPLAPRESSGLLISLVSAVSAAAAATAAAAAATTTGNLKFELTAPQPLCTPRPLRLRTLCQATKRPGPPGHHRRFVVEEADRRGFGARGRPLADPEPTTKLAPTPTFRTCAIDRVTGTRGAPVGGPGVDGGRPVAQ